MILTAPDDKSFPNGPAYTKGEQVDVAELAAAIGHPDAEALAVDLTEQGWGEAKKTPAKKAAAKKSTNPPDQGTDNEES